MYVCVYVEFVCMYVCVCVTSAKSKALALS